MFKLDPKQFPFLQDGETIELTYDSRWPECHRFILCSPQGCAWRIRMLPLWMPLEQIVKWLEVDDSLYSLHAPHITKPEHRAESGLGELPILG